MKLRFLGGTIKNLTWYPRDDDDSKFVLLLRAPLTVPLADALRCRGLCYSEPDGNAALPKKQQVHPTPRKWEGALGLTAEIAGGSIELGERQFPFSLAHKFKVARDEKASDTDITVYVSFRVHIGAGEVMLYKFCQETGKGAFPFLVLPAQGAFKFADEEDEEEDEDEEPEAAAPGTLARKASMKTNGAQEAAGD